MSQQALRKVQSFNDIPPSSSDRKSTRNSKSDSVKSHEDKNSSSNSSTDQEAEKKLEFYSNIYRMKTIQNVNIENTELAITDKEQYTEQPTLNRNFIPLILIGQDKLKGIIELSLSVSKENPDSHLICCQGLKLVLDLMDIQKNPNAQQFIDVFTNITFQDMKKFNFKAHIVNKNMKECKLFALKLLKIFVDAHSKTLTKSTRQLLMDEKTFEEYVKFFKTQNVPRQLITKAMELAEQDSNQEYVPINQFNAMNSMRMSTQKSKNWQDILFFSRNSVIDQNSKTFTDASHSQNYQEDTCDLEDLKEAIDDPTIQWTQVYNAEDSFSFQYCKQPDQYILLSFFLPLSLSSAQAAVIENRKDWDTLVSF